MSTQTKALKLALEALKKSDGFLYNWHENYSDDEADAYAAARQLNEQAIIAAEKALMSVSDGAQPEQEPVACIRRNKHDEYRLDVTDNFKVTDLPVNVELLLYTTPPQRKPWVSLSDADIYEIWSSQTKTGGQITRDIEAKLRELNEGKE